VVAKSSTSFGWGKGGKVTAAGWQVTLCDPIWHVISHSSVVISITNCYIRVYFTLPASVARRPRALLLGALAELASICTSVTWGGLTDVALQTYGF